jgi:hypothetical protein
MGDELNEPATVSLSNSASVADMAQREGFDPNKYAVSLSHHIRADGVPMDVQRERLAALAQLAGGLGAEKSAEELARHYLVLNALFDRLALQAAKAAGGAGQANAQAAERLTAGAIKAQRAAVAVLGALTVLRQQANPSPGPSLPPGPDDDEVEELGTGGGGAAATGDDGVEPKRTDEDAGQ